MRALPIFAAGAVGALACSQQALPPPAHIVGTNSVALVDDLLFVTSPGASELRVLNLRASPKDFVRAPNPLEPLSIPVLAAPTTIARDIQYIPGGDDVGDIDDSAAPYVYVQGAASAEISVVGTQRDTQLVELRRVLADGIVTAIAGRGPSMNGPTCQVSTPPPDAACSSTLYYATLNENQGRLWQIKIPPSDASGRMIGDPQELTPLSYGPGGGDSGRVGGPISSIAVMPNQNQIAVASRVAGTNFGRTILLDTSNGQQWELDFRNQLDSSPKRPFRQLVTHAKVHRSDDSSTALEAGARLFGVQDDDACGSASSDCPGILAVDTLPTSPRFTRRSLDSSGYEMVPIKYGGGLISGLSLAPQSGRWQPGADLAFPGGFVHTIDLLGIATTSNGFLIFFDAVALSVFNVSASLAQASTVNYLTDTGDTIATCPAVGCTGSYVPGPILGTQTDVTAPANPNIQVALGAALGEVVSVTYQGTIPGFRDVSVPGGLLGGETQLLAGTGDLNRLSVPPAGADQIVVTAGECTREVPLTSFRRGSSSPPSPPLLITTTPIDCSGAATFSVRAGGYQPYVVEGGGTGYMGRTGDSQTFAFPADVGDRASRYYYHQPFDLSRPELAPYDPTVPQLQFAMGPGDPTIRRDYRYSIIIQFPDTGYQPEYILADTASLGVDFHAPGASAYARSLSDGTNVSRLYVAYPSANAVLEFQPQLLTPNSANARYIGIFR